MNLLMQNYKEKTFMLIQIDQIFITLHDFLGYHIVNTSYLTNMTHLKLYSFNYEVPLNIKVKPKGHIASLYREDETRVLNDNYLSSFTQFLPNYLPQSWLELEKEKEKKKIQHK